MIPKKPKISIASDSELAIEKEMRWGDFDVPETKAPLVRCGVGRQHSADIGIHRSTDPAAFTEGLHSGQVYILGLAADGSSQLSAQAAEGSMLRALVDPASHIPDVLGGGFLNADYWFHWSSQSTSIFPRRLLKCHSVNIADKKNDEPKNHISTWTNLLFVDLITWSRGSPADFGSSYRNEPHKGTEFNHPIPDCIDFGTTCNDYINKPFLCHCICSRSWTQTLHNLVQSELCPAEIN